MEMERMIEFPQAYMDRRPRTRPRLGWDVAPQALKVLKESFKIYCAINDGIINLVDMFFDMSKHDAVKALNIYKRAGQQAENLAAFYEFCKGLELARNFQFPTLKQPPPSFLATMYGRVHKRSTSDWFCFK